MANGTDPTADELADLTLVGQKLWDLDDNRLVAGRDYTINVGPGKKAYDTGDVAAEKLFTTVSKAIWDRPTYRQLAMLRDNYSTHTGAGEQETEQERAEACALIDGMFNTRPMQYIRKYLAAKNLGPADELGFKKMLYQMWFSFYSRDAQNDTCGFEHVFLGEADSGEISGFHNWLHFWIEESRGKVDYKGHIKPRNRSEVVNDDERVVSCQFSWGGMTKSITTLFIGTSPEFEFALLTFYFLASGERTNIVVDGYELCVRCYAIKSKYGNKVGSAFVELMGELDADHE